jgi:hypothetical protein
MLHDLVHQPRERCPSILRLDPSRRRPEFCIRRIERDKITDVTTSRMIFRGRIELEPNEIGPTDDADVKRSEPLPLDSPGESARQSLLPLEGRSCVEPIVGETPFDML